MLYRFIHNDIGLNFSNYFSISLSDTTGHRFKLLNCTLPLEQHIAFQQNQYGAICRNLLLKCSKFILLIILDQFYSNQMYVYNF